MARDTFDSLAVIPNSTDNFDEVYVIVDRINGRFIEKFSLRLQTDSCSDSYEVSQNYLDSSVKFGGL